MFTVKNYSRYFCNDLGNIYSIDYKRTKTVQLLKPAVSTDGYLKTVLKDDFGNYKTIAVHRWCAEAYFGPKSQGMEVNHKNGIKTDNSMQNLEYCTRSYNMKHAFENGLAVRQRGSKNPFAKLDEVAVKDIRRVAAESGRYYGRKALAEKYGVSENQIKSIVTRRRNSWSHV